MSNFDISLLSLEIDNRGFILGESILGVDELTDTAGSWDDILTDLDDAHRGIGSIVINRSVTTDSGALIRPEAPTMDVELNTRPEQLGITYNKQMRCSYDGAVMFVGRIVGIDSTATPTDFGTSYRTRITCVSNMSQLVTNYLYNFTAPQETVAQRIARINGLFALNVTTDVAGINMAACSGVNITVFDALQDASDVALAVPRITNDGEYEINTAVSNDNVGWYFRDDGNGYDYANLQTSADLTNVVSSVIAVAKADDAKFRTRTISGATAQMQQRITVDVPADNINLDAWLASFPFTPYVEEVVRSIRVPFHEDLVAMQVCDVSSVLHEGFTFTTAVKAIEHTITPDVWDISVEFMDRSLVTHPTVLRPSAPRNFVIGNDTPPNPTNFYATWSAPLFSGGVTGYQLRRAVGTTPPSKTSGTLIANLLMNPVLPLYFSGNTPGTTYSFSLFATTDDPNMYSDPATVTIKKS